MSAAYHIDEQAQQSYETLMKCDHCLAVYGTLAPGKPNHHHLAALKGSWTSGLIRGRFVQQGWGAALGFPALILDDAGTDIEVQLLMSPDLPDHWTRLDAFEGSEYTRTKVVVQTPGGEIEAWIYLSAEGIGVEPKDTTGTGL